MNKRPHLAKAHPGTANLPIGSAENTIPGREGEPNLPIGSAESPHQKICGPAVEETATREIGRPGAGGGSIDPWRSRGYLPHFEGADAVQDVTFHLADSLPKAAIAEIEAKIKALPPGKQDGERRKRLESWMDAGHGSCILRDRAIAEMVQNVLLHFDGQRYHLLAWVVMPNHVHALFEPADGWTVGNIVASWKKFTARGIRDHLRAFGTRERGTAHPGTAEVAEGIGGSGWAGEPNLPIGSAENTNPGREAEPNLPIGSSKNPNHKIGGSGMEDDANREIGGPGVPVWHREYWDRYIRNQFHLQEKIGYIHQNPVKAALVSHPQDWPWSSTHPGTANLPIGSSISPHQKKER